MPKILVPGHRYVLDNFDGKGTQELQFIHKEPLNPDDRAQLDTLHEGTTNEEVLAVMIDRMQYLQTKFPCRENAIVITKLEESLMWLNKRTAERRARGVEGKQLP